MKLSIIEAQPGFWRWVLSGASGRVLASSGLFRSPNECLTTLMQLAAAPFRAA